MKSNERFVQWSLAKHLNAQGIQHAFHSYTLQPVSNVDYLEVEMQNTIKG